MLHSIREKNLKFDMKDPTIWKLTRGYIGQCLFLFAISCPDRITCWIFNFWSWLKSSAVSLDRLDIEDENIYVVTDKISGREWHQVSKRAAIISFLSGFTERGNSLITQYGLEAADFYETSIIIDCGANTGDFAISARQSGFSGLYLAFEPSKVAYKALSKNLSSVSNCVCFNKGLWFEETTLKFYVSEYGADSSFEMPTYYTETIDVETTTLSTVLCKLQADKTSRILLKIEAEGCEPEVLKGADSFFTNFSGRIKIAVDVGFERGISEESTLSNVSQFLAAHGFVISGYSRYRHVVTFER